MTNGYTKSFWAINILHEALKCQDVSIQWSLRHLLELFCPRPVTWIQVHLRKIEVEQTKVSQFLPCDSESFPRNIWDYWVYTHDISSSIVLVRERLTFCQSDADVQDQWKRTENTAKPDFETNYFIITSYWKDLLCRGNAIPVPKFYHRSPWRMLVLL